MERVNLRKSVNGLFYLWNESQNEFGAKVTENSVTANAVYCHRQGCVKSIPPTTENWLRKRYNYSVNNDTSTEDKHETNHINNKYNDMNMNTRKMHNT